MQRRERKSAGAQTSNELPVSCPSCKAVDRIVVGGRPSLSMLRLGADGNIRRGPEATPDILTASVRCRSCGSGYLVTVTFAGDGTPSAASTPMVKDQAPRRYAKRVELTYSAKKRWWFYKEEKKTTEIGPGDPVAADS